MCCGQKRLELRNSQVQRTAQSVPQHTFSNSPAQTVRTQLSVPPATPRAAQYQPARPQTGSVPPQAPAPVSTPQSPVSVRYLEASPIQVRGLISGMSYAFSGSQPVQQVDARDASSLLNTRFFRRAS
jgi:pyruvate/2-oxoglutarate dehydrogenase complex dihydrolipoamide acyltransferase (E2) component